MALVTFVPVSSAHWSPTDILGDPAGANCVPMGIRWDPTCAHLDPTVTHWDPTPGMVWSLVSSELSSDSVKRRVKRLDKRFPYVLQ